MKDEARNLLKKLFYACPRTLFCNDMHHNKSDRHEIGEECKPLQRYIEAMKDVGEYFTGE
jgi:hypothetical protein